MHSWDWEGPTYKCREPAPCAQALCCASHPQKVKPRTDLKGNHRHIFHTQWLIAALAECGWLPAPALMRDMLVYALICFSCVGFKYPDKPAKPQEDHIDIFTPQASLSLPVILLCVYQRSVVKQSPEPCCAVAFSTVKWISLGNRVSQQISHSLLWIAYHLIVELFKMASSVFFIRLYCWIIDESECNFKGAAV